MNLSDFHDWLMHELPGDVNSISQSLATCHRLLPASYAGFPRSAGEVAEALRALAIKGLVVERGAEWRWLNEPANVEPQGVLF